MTGVLTGFFACYSVHKDFHFPAYLTVAVLTSCLVDTAIDYGSEKLYDRKIMLPIEAELHNINTKILLLSRAIA
jgi:hypothetical protein